MNPREEIKVIAPTLSRWKISDRSTVPSDYFDTLADKVLESVEVAEKMEEYFQSLPDQVIHKIKQEETTNVNPILSYYKYVIAASIFIAVGTILWSSLTNETVSPSYSMIEIGEDLDYIIDEISVEDIFDFEFIDDKTFEEVLVSEDGQFSEEDLVDDLLFDVDDEILEEFL